MPCAIQHMTQDEIDGTFVLARLGYRELTLEAWRRIARAASGNVLVAHDAAGRPRGLLIYTISGTVAGKPDLRVERLIAFDMLDAGRVASALVDEVMKLATRRRCASLSLVVPLDAPDATAALVLTSPVASLHQVI